MTHYGLSDDTIQALNRVFQQHPKISRVLLFGSRAQGRYTEGSDIDLAISAPNMTNLEFAMLWNELDTLPLIYKMDCLHLETLSNEALHRKILETGKAIWPHHDAESSEYQSPKRRLVLPSPNSEKAIETL